MSLTSRSRDPDRSTFSWGGAGVVLLAVGVLAWGAVGKIIDGNVQHTDSTGRTFVHEGGSLSGYLSMLIVLTGAASAAVGILVGRVDRLFNNGFSFFLGLSLLWWLIGAVAWRSSQLSPLDLVTMVLGVTIAVGCVADPPNHGTVRALNWVRDVGAAGSIALSLLMPSVGTVPCRADKCGAFGDMWNGFFFHENTAAPGLIVLLPFVTLAPSLWRRVIASGLVTVLTLGSGSRTALLALVIALLVLLLHPLWRRHGLPTWARLVPLGAFFGSTLLFFGLIPIDISGRDWVYGAISDSLRGYGAVFGAGSEALTQGTGGWVSGDHGEAPHLLLQQGFVGFVLFALAMASFVWLGRTRHWQHLMAAGVLLVTSARFLTESGLEFSARTMEFVPICLAMGLASAVPTAEGNSTTEVDDWQRTPAPGADDDPRASERVPELRQGSPQVRTSKRGQ